MDRLSDIEFAKIKAVARRLSEAVDGVEYAIAMTAIETFVATTLAMVGGAPHLVNGFCDGIRRAVPKFHAALNKKEEQP